MNKLAIAITTAILGMSTVAFADHAAPVPAPAPIDTRDHRDQRDDRFDRDDDRFDRDHRNDDDVYNNEDYEFNDGRWTRRPALIWENLGVVGAGRGIIDLRNTQGRFKSLKLDVTGRMRIQRVAILFADGTRQVVRMQALVNGHMAAPVIDLAGARKVSAIVVFSSPWSRGSVTVSGLKARRQLGYGMRRDGF